MDIPLSTERIAVTGMAMCNALGPHMDDAWRNTLAMHSGLRRVTPRPEDPPHFFSDAFTPGGTSYCDVLAPCDVPLTRQDIGVPPQDFQVMSVSTRLTLFVARQALAHSGLPQAGYAPERVGVFVSQNAGEAASTLWDLNCHLRAGWLAQAAARHGQWDEATQRAFRDSLRNGRIGPDESSMLSRLNCTAAGLICCQYGFAGPSFSVGAACSSSMAALYAALHMLRAGVIDAAVIGGGEEVYAPLYMAEFCALGALARRSEHLVEPQDYSRPFDIHRNGFVLGEGAAMLVLERESLARRRNARLHGLITGAGSVTNTVGLIEPSADAQMKAIRASFTGLDYGPSAVQLVECHATSTVQGDLEEGRAIAAIYGHSAGGSGATLTAYKGQVGHTTGASGAMAIIHGLLAMRDGVFPGTANCPQPDPAIPLAAEGLRVPSQPEEWPLPPDGVRRMQVNSFAFGGACFALQLEAPNERNCGRIRPNNGTAVLTPDTPDTDIALAGFSGKERVVDGVRLISLTHQGQEWRMGSTVPAWMQEMAGLPSEPTPEDLAALSRRGLWLSPAVQAPPVAVMCCGQGSIWPGMGRALYDTFPAARAAMDRIAKVAVWDVLGLLDEPDLEKITFTRWQQPYLFLLEYAQASYLESLGFTPTVMSGHSLGELIALCLAGVYTPEQAWYILDSRAQQMAQLESEATHDTGMMAVYGGASVIEDALQKYPDLRVSNYNTPTQFILSGPSASLAEARRALRKNKIPAVLLNVSMAFHHPGMRVLRAASVRRLNEIPMQPPRLPMLSNVTTGLYPDDTPSISEYIGDLDENAVRWVECVNNMWNIYNIRHFVEFGPADTLCGLTGDIRPDAVCVPTGRKNKEVEGMRAAVARLYALGHLPRRVGPVLAHATPPPMPAASASPQPATPPSAPVAPPTDAPTPPHVEDLMPLIMEATGYQRHELAPDMDLRHDLAIRSSRFPLIMHAAEQRFGITVRFEDLMGVATIRDLADVIARLRSISAEIGGTSATDAPAPEAVAEDAPLPPLLRYLPRLTPLDMPAPASELPAGCVLIVGSAALAKQWEQEVRRLGASPLLADTPRLALDLMEGAASPQPLGVVFALKASSEDPTRDLLHSQLLLQAVLRHKQAAFCVVAATCPTADALLPRPSLPVFGGLSSLLLALALEYPKVHFRSVLALADAPQDWMLRALRPADGPLQWLVHGKGCTTPQLQPSPADPADPLAPPLPVRRGDVIVVSGGGKGITPRALEGLAPLGCTLVLLGRSATAPQDIMQRLNALGATTRYMPCDITDAAAVQRTVEQIHASLGRIDGLLHAAGLNRDATLAQLRQEDMEAVLAVKCRGLSLLLHAAHGCGLRYAAAFSSLAGWLGNYGQSNYSAANGGMAALLRQWSDAHAVPCRCIWLPPITGEGMAQTEEVRQQLRLRGLDHAWIDAAELGSLLARELCAAGGHDVLWARALPAVPGVATERAPDPAAQRGLAERPQRFPLVYPLELHNGVLPAFIGGHDFSIFSDAALRDAPQEDGNALAPASLLLACLAEGAQQPAAWLDIAGLEDVRMYAPLPCPPGVTRHARIHTQAQDWRTTPAPLWPWTGDVQVQDISANGRRLHQWTQVCTGTVLLAGAAQPLAPLWESPLPARWTPAAPQDRPASEGMEYPALHPCPEDNTGQSRYIMHFPRQEEIAASGNPRYCPLTCWLGAMLDGLRQQGNQGTLMRLGIMHCTPVISPGRVLLEFCPNKETPDAFDAQAVHENGAILLVARRIGVYCHRDA